MLSKGVFLLAVLSVGSIAVAEDDLDYQNDEPQAAAQCAVTCPAGSTLKFGYETGKTYQYRYESDIKTSAPGGTTEHSSLHMRANVQIEVVSTCEMTLKLTDVSLQDSNPSNIESRQHIENAAAFRRGLQAKSMSFAFVDGQIDAVCSESDDELWAINVKRGILSALQNTMSSLQGASSGRETDVSGNCPVKYELLNDGWRTSTIKKTKNLLSCTDRQAGQTVFQAVQYDADSDIQSMPLMRSSHSCEQEISSSDKIITKTTCTEVHVFRPFSGQDSGATTEVNYKLEYQTKTEGISSQRASSRSRSSLLYDHRLSDEELTDAVREARASLTDLCRQTEVDVRPDAPAVFNGLVKQMRKMDSANLKRLLQASKNGLCSKAEKYLRDALPVLGTTGGVIMMRDLMSQSQADDSEVDRWLTSIAFISNPTPDMMKEIQPLLTSDFERSALPVSSLINTYCQLYDDRQSTEVQKMIKTFEDELRYNCKYDSEAQRSRMIKALKAIGNAGNADRVVPTLNRCIANTEIPASLRVAAITAFRRLSCTADRSDITRLMENKEADSELRIMAYLAVMQCANADVIGRVRNLLESDETNQVGSFVWTHLTNIQETSCPMKADIQDILKDVVLSKAYDMDKRKFSRNVELSGFSEIFNVGALVESNLIWSAQSFVPRSASVNLTFDVFGQSVNLLELGGRVQGIEALLERFFGPGKDSDNSIREKRAVIRDDAFNIIDRKFSKTRDDLTLSYYMRVFGNEIRSGELYDLDLDGLKNRFNFLNWLIMLAQENRVDVTKNYLFLDSTFTVPTGAGLPLRLSVEGTATVAITASGKVDVRQMFSFPSVFDVNGSVRPSAAIEIRGEMGVDARHAKTGLRTVNRLHTSTILDGKVQLRDGKLFNLDLNLPQEKVEIFSAESHVYVTYRGQDREQENIRSGGLEKKECTGQTVSYVFGVELCGEVQLDGPFVAKAYVNKKDTYTGFHFEAGLQQSAAEMTDTVKVSMSTPGSRIDREITVEAKVDRANSQLDLNLKSPWKKVSAQGSLVNSAALKRASLRARVDDAAEYSVTAEVQIDDKPLVARYAPKVLVTYPVSREETKEISFEGTAIYTKGKKMAVNLALRNAFQQPVTLEGSVEKQEKKKTTKYDTNFQFNSQLVRGSLVGFVSNSQDNGNTWSSRADLNYQVTGGRTKERIVINHKFRDLSTNNLRSYSTDCSWTSTVHPRLNGQIGLELAFSPNSLRTKIEAGLDNVKKVTISQSGAFDFSGSDKKVNGMIKFELPYKNWDYEVKVDHIHNGNTLQSNATLKYGENQQISLDVGSKMEYDRFLRLAGEIYFKMPNVDMSITQNLVERAPREYHGDISIQGIPKVGSARATTVYKMQPRHEFTADINVAGWDPISVKGHLNPSLTSLQARGEFSQGRRNFVGDVNWQHTGTATAFNTRASAEVGYYGRSHTLTAEVTRRAQEFSTNAEFKYSDDKRFTVSSQVTATATEPKVQVRLEWPNNNFVELLAQGKYETKGWYTTTNDLEGKLQFTSSIPRLETLGGSFRHDKSAKSMKTTGEVYWAADSKITGDFSYDKNKVTLDMTTPFEGFETLKAEFAYTPKGRMFGHTSKVSWNEKQMVLTIVGEFNRPSVTGKVTFTSPFVGYESLSAGLKHVVSEATYTTNADVSWAADKQITLAINMNHNRDGWAVTNNGDLTILTPFREMRKMKLAWSHKNDNTMWKCHHEFEYGRDKYVLDVDTTHRLTRAARLLTTTASFQSPIRGLGDVRLTAEYQHDLRGVKSTGKSSLTWGSNAINYEHEVQYVPNNALVIKGQVTTPFEGYESIEVDMNNRRSGNTFTAANEWKLSRYGSTTLGGTLSYDGYTVDANLALTTPCRTLERVAVSLKNAKQQGVWVSRGSLEYPPGKSVSVDTKLGWESEKKFEIEVNTPHDYMRTMKFTSEFTGTPRNFRVSSELEHNAFNQGKIIFAASADTQSASRARAELSLRTPFSAISNFKVTAGHTRQTAQNCVTTAAYEFNDKRGSLNSEVNFRSWSDFDTKSELEYINGRKIELNTAFSTDPKISGSATLKTPFPKVRELGLTFSHEGPGDNFKSALELSYNRREKINANFDFTVSGGDVRVYSRLTTPFQALERSVLEITHSGSPGNYRSSASFEINDQKLATNGELQVEDDRIRFNGKLETPFRQLREATAMLEHTGQWRRFNSRAAVTYDDSSISGSSEFNIEGPTGKFSLTTPYRAIQSVNFEFSHENKNGRQGKGWSNSATLELNRVRYTAESEFTMTGKVLKAKANVKIPKEYSIALQHRGDSIKDFTNSVTLKIDDQTVTESSSFKYASSLIEGKAAVETSYPGYGKFETTFKHEGPVSDFKTKFTITTPIRNYRSFVTELTYTGNPNDFTSAFSIESNFQSVPRVQVNANHRYTGQALDSAITIATSTTPITASVSYKKTGSNLEAGAKLETPYEGYETFETQFRFSGERERFTTSVTVTTPFSGYERFYAELNHEGAWTRFTTSGKFETSATPSLAFSVDNNSPDAWRINTAVEVEIPAGKIAATFTNNGEPGNFRSGLRITTPYRGYNRFEVNLEHEGGTSTPKTKISVQTPVRGYTNFQLSTEKSGDAQSLQLKAELTSSVRGWEKTGASWSHSIASPAEFQSTATVETSVRGYERQSLTISHNARRNVKTTVTVETSVPGYTRFTGNFEYSTMRKLKKSSVSIETTVSGYERFAGSIEVNINDADTFGGTVDVTTPIRGYERFGATFNHNGDLSQFETTAKVTTPFRNMPQIEVLLRHRGQISDFETSAKVTYADEAIEGEVAFKRTATRYDSNYEGRLKITSTFALLRELNIAATHVRQPEVKSGTLDVTYNGEKKVDFDYKYKTSGDKEIEINIRNPYSMSTSLNMDGTDGQAVVNWDTNRQDSQVKFDFGFKDTTTSDLTDRSLRFKVDALRRKVGFEFGYTLAADRFTNRGELHWDSDTESEFAYEIEASRSSARYTVNYDAKVKVMSGLVTSTATFSHKTQVRRKHVTELVIESADRLRLSNEIVMTSTGFTDTFTVQHPRIPQDFTVTTEGTTSGNTLGFKTTVRYDRQNFILEGQTTDESQAGTTQSSASLRFAHPNSFTDVKVTGDIYCGDDKTSGNAEIQYQMTRDRSFQKFSVKTELNKANKDFSFEVTAPFDQLRLTATNRFVGNRNGMIGYEAAAQTNQMKLKATFDISLNDRSFDAKLFYAQTDYMRLFAQAVSPIQGRFELSRYSDNGITNDITANLSFSDERLLTGYAFLRPNLYDELRSSIRPDRLYPRELAAQGQQWASTMREDLNLKGQKLRNAMTPLANAAKAMVGDVSAKIDQLQTEFNAMYDRNEFYIRDIDEALKSAANKISESMQSAFVELKRSYDVFAYRVQRYMTYYNRLVQQRIDQMTAQMTEALQAVSAKFEELQPHWDSVMVIVRAHFEELKNHPRMRAIADRLNSLQLSDFLPPADWQETLARSFSNFKSKIDEILMRPELRELRDWLIKRVEDSMWMYEYLGYRDQVNNWITQARSLTWLTFKAKVVDYVKETLQLHKNRWTSWDVSRGEYGFQVFVPFDPRDLSFLQRLNVRKYICYARNIITSFIPEEDWTLLDRIFAYWPSSDRSNWIPPFKSHASITGSQHFMTFDHKAYEFAGECSYLLTRDFVDKSFSVVVNYDKAVNNRPVRRSITAVSGGKQVEVYADGKVTVDGVRAEMPLRVNNATTVARTGSAVRIDNDLGFSVVCDLSHEHCSVSVSGWYYNKMAGLLGTYDNEPSNDMTNIDNAIADTPENLAYSWTVGQKCRPNNRAVIQTLDEESKAYGICSRYFKNAGSLFRGCFRAVDPEPFVKMCVNDMPSEDDSASEVNMCNVAAAYIQECRRHDVYLRMPRQCVRCNVGDSSNPQYESSTFNYGDTNRAPKAADVVFIVQHSSCNRDLLDKVKGLVDDLEKAMKAENLTSTRYSIVGFGGKDHLQSPHSHTMDSQIFNSANKVVQGLSRFNLEAGDVRDPMDAIRYAAKLAFRPGASKTFVLLACDKCSQDNIRYRDLQMTLLESDIKLHVLVQEVIKLKSNSAKTAYIFGADRETVYTRQDVADNELRGESDLRRYILVPKDLCAALTQDTSGSVFSARQWLDSRPLIQKRFSDVMVRTFARKARPSECQECECVADEYGVGYARCRSCDAPQPFYWWYPEFEADEVIAVQPTQPKVQPPVDNRPVEPIVDVKPTRAAVPTRRPRPTQRPRLPRPTPRPRRPAVVRPRQQQQQG